MKCPHAETTTLLWIYGEGPEGHEAHVANCPDCQAVLKAHETVLFHVAEMEQPLALPVTAPPQEIPEPANRNWMGLMFGVGGLGLAVAAVFVAWIGLPSLDLPKNEIVIESVAIENTTPVDEEVEPVEEVAQIAQAKVYWDFDGFGDDWDDPFDALEEDFEILEEGLSTL